MHSSRFYIFMGGLMVASAALLAASVIGCNEPALPGSVPGDAPAVARKVPVESQLAWDMFMASCLSQSARGYDERRIANSCAYIADLAVAERRARLSSRGDRAEGEDPVPDAVDE